MSTGSAAHGFALGEIIRDDIGLSTMPLLVDHHGIEA
jgi:hypothetical protein